MNFFPSDFASSTLAQASNVFSGFMPFVSLMVSVGVVLLILSFILSILVGR